MTDPAARSTSGARSGLLLGAGASFDAGLPMAPELTRQFREAASEMLRLLERVKTATAGRAGALVLEALAASPLKELQPVAARAATLLQVADRVQAAPHVLKDALKVLQDPRLGYEDVLGYLETQAHRGSRANHDQGYPQLYSALVGLVYRLLYVSHTADVDAMETRLAGYSGMFRLAEPDVPFWIFSLNHDLVVEAVAGRSDLPLFTGFRDTGVSLPIREADGTTVHRLNVHVRTKDDLEKKGLHYCNKVRHKAINLLKLHGSLDEFAFNDGNDLLKLVPDGQGLARHVDCLRLVNERIHQPMPVTNEISYLDDDGVTQFLRRTILASAYKYDGRNRHVLPQKLVDHFRSLVNYVHTLYVVGYSFRDVHVNTVLRGWLEAAAERTMVVVNPDAKDLPQGFGHVAPQVELRAETALSFFESV